ncbi:MULTISPECIES: MFS transporter [Paracoccaceae]|jgi:MFS family permease|uniref:MFS transporter n=1 Tax=Rhodobacterales TaxID=204455 RepID=UPI001B2751B8|nr:MFS transporter [Boseongicola sp. H5]MBO6603197.1 MFS transporter [Roseicyclus sp.]MBO6623663.1 MFS transporter [Roseicyclus sp.]MBO6922883.1 MFS transporter [Roseicyclus sp.]
MRLILSFTALFLSVILLQLSSGGVGPLDVLSGSALGFSNGQIGLLGSAHFLGFFIGCWWAPRLMGSVGHSRAFAAFTATGAIGLLAHMLVIDPYAWALMRVASGLCIAGCYTVIEAWLQSKVTNDTRGRAMGVYRMVDTGGSLVAQLLIGVLAPASYVSYNILAILCCAALLPLTLTTMSQPKTPEAPRLRPGLAWRLSPLAVAGVLVAGLSGAGFRMIGPLYGQEVGLAASQIGYFLAAFVLGGALMQLPAGWLADRYDRRWVLIWFSAAAILASGITVALAGQGTVAIFAGALLFGGLTFPIYSISAAHAHDWADDTQRVELSAALMFFYATGAIVAPLASSALITVFGPSALFTFIAAGHVVLVVFGLIRMRRRTGAETRKPYVWIPRTSFQVGRLFRRPR